MFDESYTKLNLEDSARILDLLNGKINGSTFDPLDTTILSIHVPFYDDYQFLDISDQTIKPALQRYAFYNPKKNDLVIIDWKNTTLYDLNKKSPIILTDDNIFEYARFYFSFVKAKDRKMILCESADHIPWKDEPPIDVRKSLNVTLNTMKIVSQDNDTYKIKAYILLENNIFSVNLNISNMGKVIITDHEIAIENLPVLDSVFE